MEFQQLIHIQLLLLYGWLRCKTMTYTWSPWWSSRTCWSYFSTWSATPWWSWWPLSARISRITYITRPAGRSWLTGGSLWAILSWNIIIVGKVDFLNVELLNKINFNSNYLNFDLIWFGLVQIIQIWNSNSNEFKSNQIQNWYPIKLNQNKIQIIIFLINTYIIIYICFYNRK